MLQYFLFRNLMFSWARKQRLSQRTKSESVKSNTTTTVQSHPSSPAHSSFYMNSPDKYSTPQKKLKVILHKKQRPNNHKIARQSVGNIENNMTKSQLLNMINTKNSRNNARQPVLLYKTEKDCSDSHKIIKIKIEVNRILDQYCRVIKQVANTDSWGIFNIALVMLKMGFIHDLVNDRDIVKQLWIGLGQPDLLSFYVYLEQAIGNRVHIDLAISSMVNLLQIPVQQLNKQCGIRVIAQRKCSHLHQTLKLNRLCRQKNSTAI